jgi:signal transduction histidine kinase/CheY-like chemotaxis protein
MGRLSVKFRVVAGMVSLVISLVFLALYLGIIPDRIGAVREGRTSLAEAIAVHSAVLVMKFDSKRLEMDLSLIAKRNPDLLSLSLRRTDGRSMIEIGDHEGQWQPMEQNFMKVNQIRVPISDGRGPWGQLELRFKPLQSEGLKGMLQIPWVQIGLFLGLGCFVSFYLFLGRVLRQLDPSQAIPGRVRTAFDTLAEGLLVVDPKEQIVLANKSFADMLQRPPKAFLGHKVGELPFTDTEGNKIQKENRPWIQALEQGKLQDKRMMRMQVSDEEWLTFNVNCAPVPGSAGKYAGVLISFDDVTQLEKKEIELRKSKEEAEIANQAKSVFLASMSHEIRTPMNSILGFTEILKRGYAQNKEETRRHLNTIHSSGKNLLALINDILDLSKVESGHIEVEKTWAEPHRIVQDVLQNLKVQSEEKGLYLRFNAESALPQKIETDPTRFRQIIFNLVGNAIKFTETGGVTVGLRFEKNRAGSRLIVDITDTGIGIPIEKNESIFDPFTQADSSVTRRFGGTGLGLSISRKFARLLGGDIRVSSKPGKGSLFRVILAAGDTTSIPFLQPEEMALTLEKIGKQKPARWRLNKARVLVVEDGVEVRELLRLLLVQAGIDVFEAENGLEGVKKAVAETYDVILMDVNMPVMDGFAAAGKMRQNGVKSPIIAMTANAMKGSKQECLAAGYSGYFAKPIDIDQFMKMMADLVGGDQVQETDDASSGSPAMPETASAEKKKALQRLLVSSLPISNPEFQKIIIRFSFQLRDKLKSAVRARARGDLTEIAAFAHWLKGAGGTVGFDEFTEPARQLEQLANEGGDASEMTAAWKAIRRLAARLPTTINDLTAPSAIETGAAAPPAPVAALSSARTAGAAVKPLISRFAELPEFQPIIHLFIETLDENLSKMEQAYAQRDWEQLASLSHWLKGSGGTVGFDAFTKPAAELEKFAKAQQADQARGMLARVNHMRKAIVPPDAGGNQQAKTASIS